MATKNHYPKWWLEEFTSYVNELQRDEGTEEVHYFGCKTKREGESDYTEIFTIPDWGNIQKFIDQVADSAFHAGVMKFLELSEACRITSMHSVGQNLYVQLGEAEIKEDVTLVPESALQKLRSFYKSC